MIGVLIKYMNKFTKILAPIDGSKPSMDAANYALSLAKKFSSELHIVSVVPSKVKYGDSSGFFGMVPPKYFDNYKKEAEIWFDEVKKRLEDSESKNIKINTEVITSPLSISGTILEYAENLNIDLIVMGTKGRTGFKKLLVGSTAQEIVTYAHCPVLVVR
jgi:nucleotide-binding universal stress UspA family protein